MSLTSFCGRHPLATLLTLLLFIFGTAAIASTAIQSEPSYAENNPHRIPDQMNPKSEALAKEIAEIKFEIKEGIAEIDETVHTVAFQGRTSQSQPTFDYTTGTSN
jgi:enoyl-[acyl-carrier-protein] reductase (NADH)